jgi:hypothetical protein
VAFARMTEVPLVYVALCICVRHVFWCTRRKGGKFESKSWCRDEARSTSGLRYASYKRRLAPTGTSSCQQPFSPGLTRVLIWWSFHSFSWPEVLVHEDLTFNVIRVVGDHNCLFRSIVPIGNATSVLVACRNSSTGAVCRLSRRKSTCDGSSELKVCACWLLCIVINR